MATQSVPSTPTMKVAVPNTPGAPLRPVSAGLRAGLDEVTSSSPTKVGSSSPVPDATDNDDMMSIASTVSSPAILGSQTGSGTGSPAVIAQAASLPAPNVPAANQVTNISAATHTVPAIAATTTNTGSNPNPPSTQQHFSLGFVLPMVNHVGYAQHLVHFAHAQMVHGANCALFCGNLPNDFHDSQLGSMLLTQFSAFGQVFVKVLRKQINKPTAILQFTNMLDAQQAERAGRNIYIGTRKLRVERSTASKALIVTRWDGYAPTLLEMQTLFYSFTVRSFHIPTPLEAAHFGIPACCIVDFEQYGHMMTALHQSHDLPIGSAYRMALYTRGRN